MNPLTLFLAGVGLFLFGYLLNCIFRVGRDS